MSEEAISGLGPGPLSLRDLRIVHRSLLHEQRAQRSVLEIRERVVRFVSVARDAGTYLDSEDHRRSVQGLIDYWATTLFREHVEIDDSTLREFDPAVAPDPDAGPQAYVGLNAFREEQKDVFFGRERLIEPMLERIDKTRFLALIGPSGCGKSSLVMAGLLPRIKTDERFPSVKILKPIVPGSEPLATLASLIEPPTDVADPAQWRAEQVEKLKADPAHLRTSLAAPDGRPVLLYVDQFEEIFTLTLDIAARHAFVENLLDLIKSPGVPHTVVISIRQDYEDYFALENDEFQQRVELSRIPVPALDEKELRDAIVKPATQYGVEIEPRLVEALINEVLGDASALPLLQHTLFKLWKSRLSNVLTLRRYEEIGGAKRALEQTANDFYKHSLTPQQQDAARRVLLRLVFARSGAEPTSRRVRLGDLYRIPLAPETIDAVLEKLVKSALVRSTKGEKSDDDQFEITHEALIRNWRLLGDWIVAERKQLNSTFRLETFTEEWVRCEMRAGFLDSEQLATIDEAAADLGWSRRVDAFIKASKEEEEKRARYLNDEVERRTRLTRRILIGVVATLFGILAWSFTAWLMQKEASEQAQTTLASALLQRLTAEKQRMAKERELATKQRELEDIKRVTEEKYRTGWITSLETANANLNRSLERSARDYNALQRRSDERIAVAEADRDDALMAVQTDDTTVQSAIASLRKANDKLTALEAENAMLKPQPVQGQVKAADPLGFRKLSRPVLLGGSVSTDDPNNSAGSLCCFVKGKGERFVLGLATVIGSNAGTKVLQPALADGGDLGGAIANVWHSAGGFSIARLLPGVEPNRRLPAELGFLEGIGSVRRPGDAVRAFGRASGLMGGKVVEIESDGTIITDLDALPGDAGGPVINAEKELIGVVWRTANGRTAVRPIRPILREFKVDLDD